MDSKQKSQSGFTLIETLIYIALFGILFSGVVISAYSILETGGKNQAQIMTQVEGNFISAKISWALSQAVSIDSSADGDLQLGTSDKKTIEIKPDSPTASQVNLLLILPDGTTATLNNSNETIEAASLYFDKINADGDKPEGVKYGFKLNALSDQGFPVTNDFASIAYLRK